MYKAKDKFRLLAVLLAIMVLFAVAAGCAFDRRGMSAYDIAVKNGFVGTETEWLASLRGADGYDGNNAQSPDIYDIYQSYLSQPGNEDKTFEQFLKDFLHINVPDGSAQYAANVALRSVVSVESSAGAGSGVIYKLDGKKATIITNYHVIYDTKTKSTAKNIIIRTYGREFTYISGVTFLGGSISKDIAVLEVTNEYLDNGYLTAVQVSDSNNIVVGQDVIAVGNAAGAGLSASSGILSVDSENISLSALDGDGINTMRVMRVDAAINKGNSGGGLFNREGQLIGIVSAKSVQETVENMGYAIPSNVATWIADSVLDGVKEKCWLGVTVRIDNANVIHRANQDDVRTIVKERIKVESVETDPAKGSTFAYDAGLKGGDIIDAIVVGGKEYEVSRSFYISDLLFKVRRGETFHLKITRGDKNKIIPLNPNKDVYFQPL